jgi:hypothetical protein
MKKVSDILKEKAIGFVFNLVSLVVIVVILLLVIYAFAAFTEPTSAPDASNQDFNQNILGADNANNLFSSTNVAANADGSIIERLEELQGKSIGTTDVGAMTGSLTGSLPEMIKYLYDRVAGTTDIGGVTGSITGSVPEMIDYLWDNRTSFGSGAWTQCAYFQDTAGDDITATWDNGCASYNEVIFKCYMPSNGYEYAIGPLDNFADFFDFDGLTDEHVYFGKALYLKNDSVSGTIEVDEITDTGYQERWKVASYITTNTEGYTCGVSGNGNGVSDDKYWIYGR